MSTPQVSTPQGWRRFFDFRRDEVPFALLMFGYFFLVITSFWILKPLKKALFIRFYDETGFAIFGALLTGAQAELIAKVLNMLVALVAAGVFTLLSGRFRRQQLTFLFSGFFLAGYAGYASLLASPEAGTVWSFYLFGDLFSTLMVATFFAFLNDSVSSDQAKRLYGLVGLGGVAGGAFGSTVMRGWIGSLPREQWMGVCAVLVCMIAWLAWAAGRRVERHPPPAPEPAPHREPEPEDAAPGFFEGARRVFQSSYLIAIVAIVGLYEVASTVLDYQFSETVSHYLDGPAIGQQFATVFSITNLVAMGVQLFLTSFVMTQFGLAVALLILPASMLLGSGAFMAVPVLWVGSLLNTADNGFSYSLNQSAKETLYVPTPKQDKYAAKAFIDMFVQRFAKAVAVGMSLGITLTVGSFEGVRWLGIFTIPVIVVWAFAARYAGRRFAELERGSPGAVSAGAPR